MICTCNGGHFNADLALGQQAEQSERVSRTLLDFKDEYVLGDVRRPYVLCEGHVT